MAGDLLGVPFTTVGIEVDGVSGGPDSVGFSVGPLVMGAALGFPFTTVGMQVEGG